MIVHNMASLFCLVLLLSVKSALYARIAGLAAFSSGSHYMVVRNAVEELASRGHEVMLAFCLCIYKLYKRNEFIISIPSTQVSTKTISILRLEQQKRIYR